MFLNIQQIFFHIVQFKNSINYFCHWKRKNYDKYYLKFDG